MAWQSLELTLLSALNLLMNFYFLMFSYAKHVLQVAVAALKSQRATISLPIQLISSLKLISIEKIRFISDTDFVFTVFPPFSAANLLFVRNFLFALL